MRLKANATLRGKGDDGLYAHWPKGSIFDDAVEPIPQDILSEFEAGTGTLDNITPENGGGPAKASPTKKVSIKKSSSPSSNKKKAEVKAKAKTPAKTKTKKSSAKKSKRKAF